NTFLMASPCNEVYFEMSLDIGVSSIFNYVVIYVRTLSVHENHYIIWVCRISQDAYAFLQERNLVFYHALTVHFLFITINGDTIQSLFNNLCILMVNSKFITDSSLR